MYRSLCVPVDGSPHSRRAARVALDLASTWDARVTLLFADASAASSARSERLAQALPEGLRPASPDTSPATAAAPALLAEIARDAAARRIPCETFVTAGRPFEVVLERVRAGGHDLVVMGALGKGAEGEAPPDGDAPTRALGSTCERVLRRSRTDTLVVRHAGDHALGTLPEGAGEGAGALLACIDGSPQSYAALQAGIALSSMTKRPIEAVAVYDPYLHYTLFNGIVGVLSEKASKVFKFKDQEKLHEEIIDTGLAKIYQAHLEVARHVAAEKGVDLGITLLDGKAHQKVLKHATRTLPSLLLMGRIGVHSGEEMDVGATTENLLRTTSCDVLVCSRSFVPPIDVRAQESVQWVPEAVAKMERVPSFVRGVARTAIVRWAIERGHSIITPGVINSCMGDILPRSAAQAMGYVAEDLAREDAKATEAAGSLAWVCSECGHASRDYRPVSCPVCRSGSDKFEAIDRDVIASVGELERGAIEDEQTFDGVKLTWTSDAKDVLRRVPNGYERRRAKARIEKTAKVRGLLGVDQAFALDMIQQEMAETSYLSERGDRLKVEVTKAEQPDDAEPKAREASPLPWTDAAWKRICRVPQGFMRDMTREKVEQFATTKAMTSVNLALCEEGIAEGRRMMAEMIGSYGSGGSTQDAVRSALAHGPAGTAPGAAGSGAPVPTPGEPG